MSRSAAQIRQDFIDYFVQHCGHVHIPSSPVVPHDDPTLLFTNAGMNQFKPLFLGTADRSSEFGRLKRAANSQKCIRAGGKHNDLDDVGHDTYHHTFFEMLGNWSFGDYFKEDAISWAWDLLTRVWGLDPRRLHATYFGGLKKKATQGAGGSAAGTSAEEWELEPDYEARDLWMRIAGLPPERVHPGNMKDNFWEMGDTGPCGPCSELHIDLTPDMSGGALVNAGDARVIEIWNLVFIQFNRNADKSLTPLPAKHVDTGMGFERVAAVIQGKRSNYDTDVFAPIFEAIRQVTGAPPYGGRLEGAGGQGAAADGAALMVDIAYRVIGDHIRTLTFALTDGAIPDKEGRGYVLRRILRRAVRYGWQYMNMHQPFLHKLVPAVVATMGDAFPELRKRPERVVEIIREEEESFGRTLARGIELFNEAAARARGEIHGEDAFKLHDTYGFPIDLTEIMAREQGLTIDIGEYERRMEEARDKARGHDDGFVDPFEELVQRVELRSPCDDTPKYDAALSCHAQLLTLASGQAPATKGARVVFTTDRTCLYVEQGGQVGDGGTFSTESGEIRIERVEHRVQDGQKFIVHCGEVSRGTITIGQSGTLRIDPARRVTMHNHTATHLLNLALRETLDPERNALQQKGSLVDPEKTRFDFSHNKALTLDELEKIDGFVNEQIARNLPVFAEYKRQADARRINTLRAVFGEKYPDTVRVVSIGVAVDDLLKNPAKPEWFNYSVEFCGGTHVQKTGEIGAFLITAEEAVAKGVRRIVGITGDAARKAAARGQELLSELKALRDQPAERVHARLPALQEAITHETLCILDRQALRELLAELQALVKDAEKAAAASTAGEVAAFVAGQLGTAPKFGATTLLVVETPEYPIDQLKHGADIAKQKSGSAAIVFACRSGEKCTLLVALSDDLVKRGLKAGDLVKTIAPLVGGGGGGPPTMAQAGGKDPSKIPVALDAARAWLKERLA